MVQNPKIRHPRARAFLAVAGLGMACALASCAADAQLTATDRSTIAQLAKIAPRDAEIDGTVEDVECWKPSESMLDAQQFRVPCRVHYDQQGDERYRDMICIGDLTSTPVTDYCYRWAYYSDMPEFDDKPGHIAT